MARDTVGCETESDPYVIEFENCVSIDEAGSGLADLNLKPVPASSFLDLSYRSSEYQHLGIHVYNLLGEELLVQTITSRSGKNTSRLNISQLSQGIYLLKVETKNGTEVRRFAKN